MTFNTSPNDYFWSCPPHDYDDVAVAYDDLGLRRLARQIAIDCLTVPPPYSIAITGKWGTGKTSTLYQSYLMLGGSPLKQFKNERDELGKQNDWNDDEQSLSDEFHNYLEELEQNCLGEEDLLTTYKNSPCIWYSSWDNQGRKSESKIASLIKTIADFDHDVRKKNKKIQLFRRPNIKRFSNQIELLLKNDNINESLLGSISSFWMEITHLFHQARNNFDPSYNSRLFQHSIDDILENSKVDNTQTINEHRKPRLIVFIDDLDRAEITEVQKLLDATKTFLNVNNCIFIFAMDYHEVMQSLSDMQAKQKNQQYIEKIIQKTIHIPLPEPIKLSNYIKTLIHKKLHTDDHNISDITQWIYRLNERNPRKIKIFINNFAHSWNQINRVRNPITNLESNILNDTIKEKLEQCDTNDNNILIKQIIFFEYIKQYHKDIWRLFISEPLIMFLVIHQILGHSTSVTNTLNIFFELRDPQDTNSEKVTIIPAPAIQLVMESLSAPKFEFAPNRINTQGGLERNNDVDSDESATAENYKAMEKIQENIAKKFKHEIDLFHIRNAISNYYKSVFQEINTNNHLNLSHNDLNTLYPNNLEIRLKSHDTSINQDSSSQPSEHEDQNSENQRSTSVTESAHYFPISLYLLINYA